jgi:hypothetical protein
MATRATYSFTRPHGPQVTVYKHHDGYPEGAADHLTDALTAEAFIRKHPDSEITAERDCHGDTEWHYSIHHIRGTQAPLIWVMCRRPWDSEDWMTVYDGPIDAWLKEQKREVA